ncbi:MAG TPA: glycosyltransferase family 4 protein [Candidatus Paceibacterota bacterium]|nr:glycosyltransferase family 4 protein [Candidatus Paceibacterota bacterium]
MKILLVTPLYPPEIGGPATYARFLEKEIPKHDSSIKIVKFSDVRKYPPIIRHILLLCKVLRHGISADIVFAQDAFSVALPAILAAKILRKPFVVRIPGDFAWEQGRQRFGVKDDILTFQNKKYGWKVEFYRKVQKWVVQNADRVLAPSDFFAKLVSGWMNNKKAIAIYNGIDFDLLKNIKVDNKDNIFSIISSGRMVNWKGFSSLIEIISRNKSWKLFLVGDGPEKDNLKRLRDEKDLKDSVFFLGKLSQDDLWKKIKESDVFVLNSSFESFSFQVVEAMALGTPVIATTGCNLEEIIENNKNGFLVPVNDLVALENILRQLSNDKELKEKIGQSGNIRAQDFSIKKTVSRLLEIFKEII